jgi:hypothetical protein
MRVDDAIRRVRDEEMYDMCVCVGHGRSYRYGRYGPRRALAFTTNDQALHASAHDQALLRTTHAPLPWVPGTNPKPMKTSQT